MNLAHCPLLSPTSSPCPLGLSYGFCCWAQVQTAHHVIHFILFVYSLAPASFTQFSLSVELDYLGPHELQHARPPCPSPTPGVYSNSCPLSLWCHPTISSSVIPFFSRLQSSPASGSFQMSQFFASAAAKSLQSCPNLCDPIDSSPPGSSVPGILQARILE